MRNVLFSSSDFELFDPDITPQDYEFYQKHKDALKSLLEDQVLKWSVKIMISYHRNYLESKSVFDHMNSCFSISTKFNRSLVLLGQWVHFQSNLPMFEIVLANNNCVTLLFILQTSSPHEKQCKSKTSIQAYLKNKTAELSAFVYMT